MLCSQHAIDLPHNSGCRGATTNGTDITRQGSSFGLCNGEATSVIPILAGIALFHQEIGFPFDFFPWHNITRNVVIEEHVEIHMPP